MSARACLLATLVILMIGQIGTAGAQLLLEGKIPLGSVSGRIDHLAIDFGGATTGSALVGAIWQAQDDLAFDLAMRGGRTGDRAALEIRAGVTFAFMVR